MLIPAGGLADTHGRKKIFLLGVTIFLAASAACGLAGNVGWLIAARVVQAIGAALLTPASLSIVLNLAEGAGKHSKLDKRRYYVTARGSATESAALLDVCQRLKILDEAGHRAAKGMLVRIVSMLIKLAQSCEE